MKRKRLSIYKQMKSTNKYKIENDFRYFNTTEIDTTVQHPTNEGGLSSLFSILPLVTENNPIGKQPPSKSKKKKKRRPRLN